MPLACATGSSASRNPLPLNRIRFGQHAGAGLQPDRDARGRQRAAVRADQTDEVAAAQVPAAGPGPLHSGLAVQDHEAAAGRGPLVGQFAASRQPCLVAGQLQ